MRLIDVDGLRVRVRVLPTSTLPHHTPPCLPVHVQIGCAIGVCPGGVKYGSMTWMGRVYVCEYYPAGNLWGAFKENVPPSMARRSRRLRSNSSADEL